MDITDEMRRHSAAHLTARAVMNLFDNVQVDIGPATDEGFYYDFDLDRAEVQTRAPRGCGGLW